MSDNSGESDFEVEAVQPDKATSSSTEPPAKRKCEITSDKVKIIHFISFEFF